MSTPIDDELSHWDELDAQRQWPTLLLGNGLSMNLWEGFGYRSLKEKARLSEPAEAIFTQLGTANFEQCLECLHHASITLLALSDSTDRVDETYAEVRDALFDTVREVHIPWGAIPGDTSELIAQVMDYHSAVFTTSYDLCLYWSHMQNFDSVDIVDFFWTSGGQFNPEDTVVRSQHPPLSRVYYLHGGLHLWQDDATGLNGKRTTATGRLLDVPTEYSPDGPRRPLFVSEGTTDAKLRTIKQSNYLSFCLKSLRGDEAPTVVFGHALAAQDQHIVEALKTGDPRDIAVAIWRGPDSTSDEIISEKLRIRQLLPGHRLQFFDSGTHPLGDPKLRVKQQ
ncbi:DUF4917 family protein [Kineosporia rhizophila]|uniref:DUF4917 family protein n=1 Tax=Kineosporia rhizophila TaxID=84633 RepID=UPI001E3BFED6|nr:DUF4917 family protein [Kineosporia rhizophila]